MKRRKDYRRRDAAFPVDFPRRLERLKEARGISWDRLAREVGTNPVTVRRWRAGSQPSGTFMLALLDLADGVPNGLRILRGDE